MNYSKEFKEEALKLSDEIGVKKAAAQLGLKYYTLADWRSKRKEQLNAPRLSDAEQQIVQLTIFLFHLFLFQVHIRDLLGVEIPF